MKQTDRMNKDDAKFLREHLSTKEKFIDIMTYFVERSVQSYKDRERQRKGGPAIPFSAFYEKWMQGYPRGSAGIVFDTCRSPIEQMFINSLQLLFVRLGDLGLEITRPFKDATKQMSDFRTVHRNIMDLARQYQQQTGDTEMKDFKSFFDKRIAAGAYTEDDYDTFEYHRLIVENFTWNRLHLTPQAKFPEFKVNKRGIRVDLLFWRPGDEKFKLIVECDGFQFHTSREVFENDRKRDRLLKLNGYQVIRFSGAEIHKDPIAVSFELFDYLKVLEGKKASRKKV